MNAEWFTRLPVRVGSSMRTQPTSSLVTRELTREWAPGRVSWPSGRLIGSGQSRLTCLHLRDRNYLKASDSQLCLVAPCSVRFIDSGYLLQITNTYIPNHYRTSIKLILCVETSICSFKILIKILLSESFERRNLSKKYYIYIASLKLTIKNSLSIRMLNHVGYL